MIDRSQLSNAFEFVVVASARARQLMNGCIPRVAGDGKPARIAQREVAGGIVEKIDERSHVDSANQTGEKRSQVESERAV